MDHKWAVRQLKDFVQDLDYYTEWVRSRKARGVDTVDNLVTLDPIMRDLANAARPGFGDYPSIDDANVLYTDSDYWEYQVKPWL
jgi:hypothetical protein